MIWASWDAFWAMGGYGPYVWGSYGVVLLCIAIEIFGARAAQRASVQSVRTMQEETDHDATS